MPNKAGKRIGLLIGKEWSFPSAVINTINKRSVGAVAELIQVEAVRMEAPVPYQVIIDRISHNIPFYRPIAKYAAMQGCYLINNPFVWSADDKFVGITLLHKLGLKTPRTVIMPNKTVELETTPESFRNLKYPMDWDGIVAYVGVPAIFKDSYTGGRRIVHRVHSVDELIDAYDQSGTLTMILQEVIESDQHIHCFVVGQAETQLAHYLLNEGKYAPTLPEMPADIIDAIRQNAIKVTKAYGYDINMVEFVIREGEPIIINPSNPAPQFDLDIFPPVDFQWAVDKIASLAIDMAFTPKPQPISVEWS